jgi:ankyrin repeat protein
MKNRGPVIRKLLLVEHVDTSRALNWACTECEEELVIKLLANPQIESGSRGYALSNDASKGHVSIVEYISKGTLDQFDFEYYGYNALRSASRYGHLAVVEVLLAGQPNNNRS